MKTSRERSSANEGNLGVVFTFLELMTAGATSDPNEDRAELEETVVLPRVAIAAVLGIRRISTPVRTASSDQAESRAIVSSRSSRTRVVAHNSVAVVAESIRSNWPVNTDAHGHPLRPVAPNRLRRLRSR
jgi:hypothetical protein